MKNNKIFDKDIVLYLLDTGVSENEIMKIQFKELKKSVIARLELIISIIKNDEFRNIKDYLEFSPSGDDMGCDNNFINFGDSVNKDIADIKEVSYLLGNLKDNIK